MNRGDYLLCTFQGDTSFPAVVYPAEIRYIDLVGRTVDCLLIDSGLTLTADYSPADTGAWSATDENGTSYVLETHDIYVAQDASPGQGDVALLTFADGSKALAFVESISNTINFQLYQQPYHRISVDIDLITASEWDSHPQGETLASIQRCYIDNSVPAEESLGIFSGGWWSLAARRDAHAGRVGGAINPFSVVIHTTDMPPGSFAGLINRWTTAAGQGNGAHFAIGRDETEGLVQLVPIDRNGNHAGGPGHGQFVAGNQQWHPNLVSVGIEIHCAGAVRQHQGQWRLFTQGAPSGPAIPDDEVIPDPQRPGRGWQTVTDYQYGQLATLLDGLETALAPMPAGCVAESVEEPPAWGQFADGRVVGHVSLDAGSRGDPWPATCDWLRAR